MKKVILAVAAFLTVLPGLAEDAQYGRKVTDFAFFKLTVYSYRI